MADTPKKQQKDSRRRRLSAALRDNLKRRKTQAKRRAVEGVTGRDGADGFAKSHDSAGISEDKG